MATNMIDRGQLREKYEAGTLTEHQSNIIASVRKLIGEHCGISATNICSLLPYAEPQVRSAIWLVYQLGEVYISGYTQRPGSTRRMACYSTRTSPDQVDAELTAPNNEEFSWVSDLNPRNAGETTLKVLSMCLRPTDRGTIEHQTRMTRKQVNRILLRMKYRGLIFDNYGTFTISDVGKEFLAESRRVNERPEDGAQVFSTLLNAPYSPTPESGESFKSIKNLPVYVPPKVSEGRPGAGDFRKIPSRGAF